MIGFAGMSHLGLVSSVAAAARGFDVLAFSSDMAKDPRPDCLTVFEPGVTEAWTANSSRLRFSNRAVDLRECRVVFVSQDVDTDDHGASDLTKVEALFHRVVKACAPGSTIVVLSQIPPGTARRWSRAANERYIQLHCQVETLIFGRALQRAMHPERFIIGSDDPGAPLSDGYQWYLDHFQCPIFRLRYESAELSKIAINMFLVSSISTTNMLAEMCEQIGADWEAIAATLRLDQRIGPHAYLTAGLGFAGGNLERDLTTLRTLAARFGTDARLVNTWQDGSRHRRDWVLRELHRRLLSDVPSPTIGIWGLAYKADTASTRNSPALALIHDLSVARIQAYDPQATIDPSELHVQQMRSAIEACRGADALAVMTPWQEFKAVPLAHVKAVMRGRLVLDPFNILDRSECAFHGLRHCCLGKASTDKEVVV
jgi:UDPglucose 6-dehydrogenase